LIASDFANELLAQETSGQTPESHCHRAKLATAVTVELFGHVTLVEGYAPTNFTGCHALIALRDTPGKTVAVLTSQHGLQTILETALSSGNLIAFFGQKLTNPPTPRGGTWSSRCLQHRRRNSLFDEVS
jgi:hypothetical protein